MAFQPTKIAALDVGGTGIKAALLDRQGNILGERVRLKTPPIRKAADFFAAIGEVTKQLDGYQAVSIGFPGVIRHGEIHSSPTLKTDQLDGVNLEKELQKRLKVPIRARNDAEVQALPAIKGKGVEVVITLGTGFGFAIFEDGRVSAHLEMSTHHLSSGKTYNQRVGAAALEKKGRKRWLKAVDEAIDSVYRLTQYDHLYIGGGNAAHLKKLPKNVSVIPNDYGLRGGAWLWKPGVEVR